MFATAPVIPNIQLDWNLVIFPKLTYVWNLVSQAVDFVINNDALLVLFAASLIPIGFKIFKKAKKSF